MESGWQFGLYISAASAVGVILLVAIFLAVRFFWNKKQSTKKIISNGILGQMGISQKAPNFTIPLMVPMLIQDSLTADGESDFTPISDRWKGTCLGLPILVQPECDSEDQESSGPVVRRLRSLTDVSIFRDEQTSDSKSETSGPWTSGTRRESLFFPTSTCSIRRPRSNTTGTFDEVSLPVSPTRVVSTERKDTTQSGRRISESSTSSDGLSRSHHSTSSDLSDPLKRKIYQPIRGESWRLKNRSLKEGSVSKRPPLVKRFSEIHRRPSIDNFLSVATPKPAKPLPSTKRGRIMLSMDYKEKDRQFVVHLINAMDLPMKNNNLIDSYARLSLGMPTKQHRQQSKVHKKTCNPIYDETFVFEDIDFSMLLQSILRLKVLNKDSFTRTEVIGEAAIYLSDEGVLTGKTITRELLPKSTATQDGSGELLVSVCHYATSAQLKVIILKMKDLPKSCKNPTISIELTHKEETVQKQQTRPKKPKKSTSPVFNEEFNFHIPTSTSCTIESYSVQFSMFSQDILRDVVCLGYVTLGLDAPYTSEVDHWKSVVSCPHKPVTEWHKFHRTPH